LVNTLSLQEIVVTALGIEKDKAKVGYAIQDVEGADLIKAREPNPDKFPDRKGGRPYYSAIGRIAGSAKYLSPW
jgi:hypothetical protein